MSICSKLPVEAFLTKVIKTFGVAGDAFVAAECQLLWSAVVNIILALKKRKTRTKSHPGNAFKSKSTRKPSAVVFPPPRVVNDFRDIIFNCVYMFVAAAIAIERDWWWASSVLSFFLICRSKTRRAMGRWDESWVSWRRTPTNGISSPRFFAGWPKVKVWRRTINGLRAACNTSQAQADRFEWEMMESFLSLPGAVRMWLKSDLLQVFHGCN